MMKHLSGLIVITFLASPSLAETCPAPRPERSEIRMELLDRLAATKTPMEGQSAADALWMLWMRGPDERATLLLRQGMAAMREAALGRAEDILTELVAYCPDFAEGWNQRAFTRFLAGRDEASLADIEEVLKREPSHFGALSGQARIYLRQGRAELAQIAIGKAISVHPWLAGPQNSGANPGTEL